MSEKLGEKDDIYCIITNETKNKNIEKYFRSSNSIRFLENSQVEQLYVIVFILFHIVFSPPSDFSEWINPGTKLCSASRVLDHIDMILRAKQSFKMMKMAPF